MYNKTCQKYVIIYMIWRGDYEIQRIRRLLGNAFYLYIR